MLSYGHVSHLTITLDDKELSERNKIWRVWTRTRVTASCKANAPSPAVSAMCLQLCRSERAFDIAISFDLTEGKALHFDARTHTTRREERLCKRTVYPGPA